MIRLTKYSSWCRKWQDPDNLSVLKGRTEKLRPKYPRVCYMIHLVGPPMTKQSIHSDFFCGTLQAGITVYGMCVTCIVSVVCMVCVIRASAFWLIVYPLSPSVTYSWGSEG